MSAAYFMKKFLENRRRRVLHKINKPSTVTNNAVKEIKCRLCLKKASIHIFNRDSLFDIPDAIQTFGGIQITEEDDYAKQICITCHSFLEKAISFRKSVQNTNKLLHQNTEQYYYDNSEDINNADDNLSHGEGPILKSYSCKLCKKHFRSLDEFIVHKNSKMHKNVRIQCPVCYGLLTAQLYKKHLARHQSASHLICDICGKLYRKDNLVRHLQLHNYDLPFQCQICPYRGRFMESLKIHMRTHTGSKPFSCDKCELRFLTRSNLNRHLLTHKKERPFKCIECGRGFYTKRDMEVHFKADHAGLKDFNCRMCGNKYGTRKALMRHELRVHKRDKMAKGRVPLYLQAEYQKQVNDVL